MKGEKQGLPSEAAQLKLKLKLRSLGLHTELGESGSSKESISRPTLKVQEPPGTPRPQRGERAGTQAVQGSKKERLEIFFRLGH